MNLSLYLILGSTIVLILLLIIQIHFLKKTFRDESKNSFKKLNHLRRIQFYNIQDFILLSQKLNFRKELPYFSTEWSISPKLALLLVEYIDTLKPKLIVETGSGLSTLIAGYAFEKTNTNGQIVSLEHLSQFKDETQKKIMDHGLNKYCLVVHCPIEEHKIKEEKRLWYHIPNLPEQKIDILVVDGPYGSLQKNARYPAIPLLYDKLNDSALIIVDDSNRTDESQMIKMWIKEFPGLSILKELETETGVAVLQYKK